MPVRKGKVIEMGKFILLFSLIFVLPSIVWAEPKTQFGNGKYIVGEDIAPGTYKSKGPGGGIPICSYQRLKGLSGAFEDIIATENIQGPAVVTIKPTDKGFFSQGCQTWVKNENP